MYNIGYCKICKQGLLEIVKDKLTKKIFICCDECEAEWNNPEDALKGILTSYPGKNPVVIYCKTERAVNRLGRDYMVSGDENLLFDLEKRYGKENIRVRSLGI